jgi:hypothetical protein
MRALLSLVLIFTIGCATPSAYVPTVAVERRIEEKPLPPDPATEPLPTGTPSGDWLEPAEKGQTLTRSGILISEARATRDGIFRIRYPELRRNYEADRQVWMAHRELYEARLKAADEALKKAEPGWWQQHGPALGMVAGFLVGAALTVALTYALSPPTTK